MACFVIAGFFAIGLGLLSVFGKDTLWKIRTWRTRAPALVPQRTADWERRTTLWGIGTIIIGMLVLLLPVLVRWGQ